MPSCEKSTQKSNEDVSPPQCVILYPSDGESVFGEVVIQARAIDNQKISHVEFYINQEVVYADSTSNHNDIFTYRWNTLSQSSSDQNIGPKYIEDEYYFISIIAMIYQGIVMLPLQLKIKLITSTMNHRMLLYLSLFKVNP